MYLYVCISKHDPYNALSFACVGAAFILSLIFINKSPKKILITIALGVNVIADYFLVLMPSEENKLIGLCIFLVVQFAYFIYTVFLPKNPGVKVTWIAIRALLCLLVGLIVPRFITLGTIEMLGLIYIVNSFVTLVNLLCYIKFEWLTFIGFLLFFICDIFVGLTNGGADLIGITGKFLELFYQYDFAFFFYIPGIFTIALSSVWEIKNWWK